MSVKSTFALLDVKHGRAKLSKLVNKHNIPVTIYGTITGQWGSDDGVSIEFEVAVSHVELGEPVKVEAPLPHRRKRG